MIGHPAGRAEIRTSPIPKGEKLSKGREIIQRERNYPKGERNCPKGEIAQRERNHPKGEKLSKGEIIQDDDDDCYIYSFYRTSSHVNKTKENNSTYYIP